MIRALIADDEPLARGRLRTLLNAEPDFRITGEARNGLEALEAIGAGGVDVAFLDVQMPILDGFEVLDSLATTDLPHIVIVTAFEQHALRAFDANAVDYLVKPFENERFRLTLQKLRRAEPATTWHQRLAAARADLGRFATRLAVRHARTHELIDVRDIDYLSTHRNYVRLHLGSRVRLLRCTMTDMEARLDPREFIRVHRSTIVNISRIRTIQPHSGSEYQIVLSTGDTLKTSRSYRSRVAELMR